MKSDVETIGLIEAPEPEPETFRLIDVYPTPECSTTTSMRLPLWITGLKTAPVPLPVTTIVVSKLVG